MAANVLSASLNFSSASSAPGAFVYPSVCRVPSGETLYLRPGKVVMHDLRLRQDEYRPSLDSEGYTWLSLPFDDLDVKHRGHPGNFIPGPDIPGIPCPVIRSLAALSRCGSFLPYSGTYIKPGAIVTTTAPLRLSSQRSLRTDHTYSQPTGASTMHLVHDGKAIYDDDDNDERGGVDGSAVLTARLVLWFPLTARLVLWFPTRESSFNITFTSDIYFTSLDSTPPTIPRRHFVLRWVQEFMVNFDCLDLESYRTITEVKAMPGPRRGTVPTMASKDYEGGDDQARATTANKDYPGHRPSEDNADEDKQGRPQ
ncbi:hypothetical protein BDZ89DRAFT_1039599 [Hymenopellis radicata]|nr:hypothetical protein BDZ89DRAFT_1039599 [Hymenopellis radicata]